MIACSQQQNIIFAQILRHNDGRKTHSTIYLYYSQQKFPSLLYLGLSHSAQVQFLLGLIQPASLELTLYLAQLVWISALISHSGCPNTQDLLWFALFLGILNLLDHVIKTFPPQKAKPPGPPQTQVIRI